MSFQLLAPSMLPASLGEAFDIAWNAALEADLNGSQTIEVIEDEPRLQSDIERPDAGIYMTLEKYGETALRGICINVGQKGLPNGQFLHSYDAAYDIDRDPDSEHLFKGVGEGVIKDMFGSIDEATILSTEEEAIIIKLILGAPIPEIDIDDIRKRILSP